MFGGKKVRGNGKVVTQDRTVGEFTNIDVSGAIQVRITQASPAALKITTDENLMEYVEVKVDGKTLVIQSKSGYNLDPSEEVTVFISAPAFNEINISGASNVIAEGSISGNEMSLHASGASEIKMEVKLLKLTSELSGASTLNLKGEAKEFFTDASGASKILCLDLNTENTELDLSGASNASITAEKELKIEASGASNVEYRGNANINQKSSGASNVKKI